jgi:formate hydrogenlyase subunit 5
LNNTLESVLDPAELPSACQDLLQHGGRMQMAYAWYPEPGAPPEILYLGDQAAHQPFVLLRCRLTQQQRLPSLAIISPLLGWYEREIHDLCGINFEGHPEPYPLVLHEGARPALPPLDPRYHPDEPIPFTPSPWQLPEIQGQDIQHLPFGPVRGDVLESAQIVSTISVKPSFIAIRSFSSSIAGWRNDSKACIRGKLCC